MKKHLLLTLTLLLIGCNTATPVSPETSTTSEEVVSTPTLDTNSLEEASTNDNTSITIQDDTFFTQMEDIFVNLDDYIGKTVTFEGFVMPTGEEEHPYGITRFYEEDHGDHSHTLLIGLVCSYDGTWPAQDTWVEVTVTIDKVDGELGATPIGMIQQLTIKEERGLDTVTN